MKKAILSILTFALILSIMTACVETTKGKEEATPSSSVAEKHETELKPIETIAPDNNSVTSASQEPIPAIKETEQVNDDGSVTLLGDKHTRFVDWEIGELVLSIPVIRGETIAQSKESFTLYNSGVTMRVSVQPKETAVELNNKINDKISYEIDNDDVLVNNAIDDTYTASYLINVGANYDPEVYNRALALFGVVVSEDAQ